MTKEPGSDEGINEIDDLITLGKALGSLSYQQIEDFAEQSGSSLEDLLDILEAEGIGVTDDRSVEEGEEEGGESEKTIDPELADPLRVLLSAISYKGPLRPEEEVFLAQRIEEGDREARRILIEANVPLVLKIASGFHRRGLPSLEDMVQDGCIGLIRAVDKFDWRKGFRFSSYAVWWIRQQIMKGLADQTRLIRIPYSLVEVLTQINRASERLRQELGREPTVDDLVEETGFSRGQVEEALSALPIIVSLEGPAGEEADLTIEEVVPDTSVPSPEEMFFRSLARRYFLELLEVLTDRERQILKLRYGLIDGKTRTLEDISKILRITVEGARRLEMRALEKLRDPQYRDLLNRLFRYLT